MNLKKVEWHNKTRHLIQDSSEGLEFAFVSKDYKQVHQLVWCKDFLNDVIYGHVNNKKATIWNFSYDPNKHLAPDLECTRLLLTSKRDPEFPKRIEGSLAFVNGIEDHLKMPRTVMEQCHEPPRHYRKGGVFIFNGHQRWQIAPPMLSLYALLIRVGLAHHTVFSWRESLNGIRKGLLPAYYEEDRGILEDAEWGIEHILKYGDKKVFYSDIRKNYPVSVPTDTMHNDFGIVGYSKGYAKTHCPHWYLES